MCFYSAVSAHGISIKPEFWTRPIWTDYQTILVEATALDAKLGQTDCAEASKSEWMKGIEARLQALEKAGPT